MMWILLTIIEIYLAFFIITYVGMCAYCKEFLWNPMSLVIALAMAPLLPWVLLIVLLDWVHRGSGWLRDAIS